MIKESAGDTRRAILRAGLSGLADRPGAHLDFISMFPEIEPAKDLDALMYPQFRLKRYQVLELSKMIKPLLEAWQAGMLTYAEMRQHLGFIGADVDGTIAEWKEDRKRLGLPETPDSASMASGQPPDAPKTREDEQRRRRRKRTTTMTMRDYPAEFCSEDAVHRSPLRLQPRDRALRNPAVRRPVAGDARKDVRRRRLAERHSGACGSMGHGWTSGRRSAALPKWSSKARHWSAWSH